MQKTLFVKFLSCWSAGSGLGNGYISDSMVFRGSNGLPEVSGRALKGALREGAKRLSACAERADLFEMEKALFGSDPGTLRRDEASGLTVIGGMPNKYGRIRVSPAVIPQEVQDMLPGEGMARDQVISDLFCYRQNTAIRHDNHQVQKGSLRNTECGIPGIVLEAEVDIEESGLVQAISESFNGWLDDYLGAVAAAVKSIGADRARGLGRCKLSFGLSGGDRKARLPENISGAKLEAMIAKLED